MKPGPKALDLTGHHYGQLEVLHRAEDDAQGRRAWVCRCVCGGECIVSSYTLRRHNRTNVHCGCQMGANKRVPRYQIASFIGRRFGRLTVKSRATTEARRGLYFNCQCDCGGSSVRSLTELKRPAQASCGCSRKKPRKYFITKYPRSYGSLISRAEINNRLMDLTEEQFDILSGSSCHYCGAPPTNRTYHKGYTPECVNGIDRVDSKQGYTQHNCVACCRTCNIAKNNHPLDKFRSHTIAIYNHWASKEGQAINAQHLDTPSGPTGPEQP